MATIADELLNDFEDSGSEDEEEQNGGLYPESEANGADAQQNGDDMGSEGDEDAIEDADLGISASTHLKTDVEEDEAETKARVEKMELKTVADVRSVAGLMKQLQPVIEVSP